MFKKNVVIAIVLLLYQTASAMDFLQLKDTYSILDTQYKHCSPVHGAVWAETGILKKYYKYYARAKKPADKENKNEAEYFTIKLLQKIFYLVGESLSVTRNVGMPEHYFSPNIIGSIVGAIEKTPENDKKQLSNKIENIIKSDTEFLKNTKTKTKLDLKDDLAMNVRIKRLANAIVGSLKECDYWRGKNSMYPRYMTHAILLACLYKISNEKGDLKKYFNTLHAVLGKNIFTDNGKKIFSAPQWDSSKYDRNALDSIINICATQANLQPSQNVLSQLLQILSNNYQSVDPFEALVCAEINKQFYSKSLPLIIGQNKGQPTFAGINYSDCAEVALRNLCNFIVFDQEKLMFIPVETETIVPSEKIKQYYQGDQADAKKHSTGYMYQIWGDLLQNIPGVMYSATEFDRRLLGNDLFNQYKAFPCYILLNPKDITTLKLPKTTLNGVYALTINGENYLVVDSSIHKAYGAWQSLKNVIILLNYLFGLKHYDNPLAPFQDPTFCSKYFPSLCKKLGWNFNQPYYELAYPNPPPRLPMPRPFSLDTPYIYWCHTIKMSLSKDPRVSWDMHIKWHHIEIRNLQTPASSSIFNAYKQKFYDELLVGNDSMETYALLALYASKTDEQKNKAEQNVLNNDTVKNRFVMYLQDLDTISPQVLKIIQGDTEVSVAKKGKEKKDDLQTGLKQLKGTLLQLHNAFLHLKETLGTLRRNL